ncbi:MAG: hypothetical protein V7L22_02055 [Nostoc sp.]
MKTSWICDRHCKSAFIPIQNPLRYLVGQNSLALSAACLNAKKASLLC